MKRLIGIILSTLMPLVVIAQDYDQDGFGNESNVNPSTASNRNFNKRDTASNKEIPMGIYAWTIDRKFGNIRPAEVDTMPHLYQNTIFNTGIFGQYNTTGNNYTPRQNRIVIDRPLFSSFMFTQPYSHVMIEPDQLRFTNTLSPITNLSYDNCGDKTNGEDHLNAKFAVNASKRLGMGFILDYSYARGYYNSQSASHFGANFYVSYLGDKYKMHTIFSTYHQKVAENGGITDDNYITHPESFDDNYSESEIPTVFERNWNRNDNIHFFLNHSYSLGFYHKVKMSEREIKARQFAKESMKDNANTKKDDDDDDNINAKTKRNKTSAVNETPLGRPDNAVIMGDEPAPEKVDVAADTTRISIADQAAADSLMRAQAIQDSIDATMKDEFVPVTSFIHTLDINKYDRIYQAYQSPADYYANTYFDYNEGYQYGGDSIYDKTRHLSVKNTFAVALLEGFNKYAKAGLKVFASHELRTFKMPGYIAADNHTMVTTDSWNENHVSIGGQIIKSQGKTFHYDILGETWLTGEDAGQIKIDFSTDLNFKLWGDTLTLAAKAYFYKLAPTFYQRHYHSKHIWWDNDNLNHETRTRIEGLFAYRKTKTQVRVAIEEIQNYTYFGMGYDATTEGRTNMFAGLYQCGSNINLLTAQLRQDVTLGPLNWENIITFQNSGQQDVLPVPTFNVFSNIYLKFKLVGQLAFEIGASATIFSKYKAPDFCPQLNQYAVQKTEASKVDIGGYPFIDAYANMHLKHARFFVMFSHANAGNGNKQYFLAPHYPQNGRILRMGVSWNFFN